MLPNNTSPDGTRATSPQHLQDLTHMTSHSNIGGALLSPTSAFAAMTTTSPTRDEKSKGNKRKASQNLRGAAGVIERVGSPNSIPSSPTSVHSSSSAIFERDIEPMLSPSSASLQSPTSPSSRHPVDPHRIPRARNTEQLEQAVPSVLDSAAAVLATLDIDSGGSDGAASPGSTMDQVAVVAPATSTLESMLGGTGRGGRSSGFASPLSFRSRSPSPLGSKSRDVLLNIPTTSMVSPHTVSSTVSSPTRSPKARQATLGTSPPARNSTLSTSPMARTSSLSSSPPKAPALSSSISKDSTLSALSVYETPALLTPTADFDPNANATNLPSPTRSSTLTASSHPPSPHAATKRLSFMSYSDLLSSTPASTMPLTSLTKEARGDEPPPHIPSVSGLNLVSAAAASVGSSTSFGGHKSGSRTPSVHGFSLGGFGTSPSPPPPQALNHAHSMGGLTHGPNKRDSIAMMDNVGGEWEREGLGMGLEERLERVGGGSVGGSLVGSPVRGVVGLKA